MMLVFAVVKPTKYTLPSSSNVIPLAVIPDVLTVACVVRDISAFMENNMIPDTGAAPTKNGFS
jgi:hypothetical protein